MSNVDVVREIYDAFGRGDVPAILARLHERVEWEYGVHATSVPWLQPRHGRDAVAGFFRSLAEDVELRRFVLKDLLEGPDVVVALVDVELVVRATGRRVIEEDEVHLWRFADGKVARFRHRVDTHQHERAAETG